MLHFWCNPICTTRTQAQYVYQVINIKCYILKLTYNIFCSDAIARWSSLLTLPGVILHTPTVRYDTTYFTDGVMHLRNSTSRWYMVTCLASWYGTCLRLYYLSNTIAYYLLQERQIAYRCLRYRCQHPRPPRE